MDFNATVDLIIRDLNEAREIIDDLKNYPGVPALQIELAKSKCKSAGEVIALLKNFQNSFPPERIQGQKILAPQKKEMQAKKNPDIQKPVSRRVSPVTKEDIADLSIRKSAESTIIADTFNDLPDSLNKKLGSLRDDDDIADILKTKPLMNLSDAIGVNDKFLFIRELFDGNPESYSQAIEKLDEAATLADAKAVIMSYTGENIETDAAMQLLDLVKRKFPGDE
jgi:hypothetical protein